MKITLLDGGLGQEIHHRSNAPAHPLWSIKVMLDNPELVQQIYQEFANVGCNVLTLNTYTATPSRLKRNAADKGAQLLNKINEIALELANNIKSKSPQIQIAGCLPPLVASYYPDVGLAYDESVKEYNKIVALQQDGTDFFLCETMSSITEAIAATTSANISEKPVIVCFSLREDSSLCLRSGEPLENAIAAILPLKPAGIMLNCSTPETISFAMPLLSKMAQQAKIRFGGYANGFTSIDALEPGKTVDVLFGRIDLSPAKYADFTEQWVAMGATLIGGCCEISPTHMQEVYNRLIPSKATLIPV
jgi:S-methylmethionine-dependent homocysteine/selenocysteine methylase